MLQSLRVLGRMLGANMTDYGIRPIPLPLMDSLGSVVNCLEGIPDCLREVTWLPKGGD